MLCNTCQDVKDCPLYKAVMSKVSGVNEDIFNYYDGLDDEKWDGCFVVLDVVCNNYKQIQIERG